MADMKERRGQNKKFWNKEYQQGSKQEAHLVLSQAPSEDLIKCVRWLERQYNGAYLVPNDQVLDLGCGNGRNLIYLAKEFGVRGTGFDISEEAIAQAGKAAQAQKNGVSLPIHFETRSITEVLPLPDTSQTLVLDMMTSHFLNSDARKRLSDEIARVLKPGGWLFFKTFLLEGDEHARRLLRDHPAQEPGSYIHPTFGGTEHVFTEEEISQLLAPHFTIERAVKSHAHLRGGRAYKRRSISVYARKESLFV